MKVEIEYRLIGSKGTSIGYFVKGKNNQLEWQPFGCMYSYSIRYLKEIVKGLGKLQKTRKK